MGFTLNVTDSDDINSLESSGSMGLNFNDLANEDTASLGLTDSLTVISSSMVNVLDEGTTDAAHHLKFLTAKIYNNREAIGKVWTADQTFYGNKRFKHKIGGSIDGDADGNAGTATQLETARKIGGTSFNGTTNITPATASYATTSSLTTGNAATATQLETARSIGGVSFDGSADINLPGVNRPGTQNTTGTAAGLTAGKSTLTFSVNKNVLTITDGTYTWTLQGK